MFFKSRLFNESLLVICFSVEIFASNDTSAVTDPSALCKVNDVLFFAHCFLLLCLFFLFFFWGWVVFEIILDLCPRFCKFPNNLGIEAIYAPCSFLLFKADEFQCNDASCISLENR